LAQYDCLDFGQLGVSWNEKLDAAVEREGKGRRREVDSERNTYIPEFSAISRFSDIVVSLTMSTEIQNLVLDTIFGIFVQFTYVMFEFLPLSRFADVLKRCIRRVGLLNETKVFLCLIGVLVWRGWRVAAHAREGATYIVKGISISIGKTLLEDVGQDAKLIFGVWWWESDCCHIRRCLQVRQTAREEK
jgi:hypothetical protein